QDPGRDLARVEAMQPDRPEADGEQQRDHPAPSHRRKERLLDRIERARDAHAAMDADVRLARDLRGAVAAEHHSRRRLTRRVRGRVRLARTVDAARRVVGDLRTAMVAEHRSVPRTGASLRSSRHGADYVATRRPVHFGVATVRTTLEPDREPALKVEFTRA